MAQRVLLLALSVLFMPLHLGAQIPQIQHYYFADFVGSYPGNLLTTTDDPSNQERGDLVFSTIDCGGKEMILWRTTRYDNPQKTESHVLDGSYWLSLSEIDYLGASMSAHRVWRDDATLKKGVIRFPAVIPARGHSNSVPAYWEEDWDLVCYATTHSGGPGLVFQVDDDVELNGATLFDCMGLKNQATCSSANATPVIADVWHHTEYWQDNIEVYRFARWLDPATGQPRGVGLIGWDRCGHSWAGCSCSNPCLSSSLFVMSDQPASIPCITCPDPGRP